MKKSFIMAISLLLAACTPSQQPRHNAGTLYPASQTMPDPEVLARYTWHLTNATNSDGQRIESLFVQPAIPVRFFFKKNSIGILGGCNHLGGRYTLDQHTLVLQSLASTMMSCPEPVMNIDKTLTQILTGSSNLRLDLTHPQPRLIWTSQAGDQLLLEGMASAETRYASEPQLMFLEVAAHTRPCGDNKHQLQCLQVREIHYNSQGIRTGGSGQWHDFNQPIEGYQHKPHERVVLRIKKYADNKLIGAKNVYVLDAIIEQEQLR